MGLKPNANLLILGMVEPACKAIFTTKANMDKAPTKNKTGF